MDVTGSFPNVRDPHMTGSNIITNVIDMFGEMFGEPYLLEIYKDQYAIIDIRKPGIQRPFEERADVKINLWSSNITSSTIPSLRSNAKLLESRDVDITD